MRDECDFSKGRRGAVIPSPDKTRITIMLDDDVIEHFRAQAEAEGVEYRTLVNALLRKTASSASKPEAEKKAIDSCHASAGAARSASSSATHSASTPSRLVQCGFCGLLVLARSAGTATRVLHGLNAVLEPGAKVVLLDNRFVEGSSSAISECDPTGNTCQ